MLNSGAVLQQRALFHLKMPSGQCHHKISQTAYCDRSQQAVLFYYHIEVFATAVILALLYDSVRNIKQNQPARPKGQAGCCYHC